MTADPFVQEPKVKSLGQLVSYPRLYSVPFLYYNTLLQACVSREWPTVEQKKTRDAFWSLPWVAAT